MSSPHAQASQFNQLWGWPLAIGVLSATGLVTALVSDGWGDVWSWVGLGVPVLVMAWFGLRRPASSAARPNPSAAARAES